MTALPLSRPLTRSVRRLCVGLMLGGVVAFSTSLWAYLSAGHINGPDALLLVASLGLVAMFAPYALLLRRFRPLPDMDNLADERQLKRHAAAYRLGFQVNWGLGVLLGLAYWVAKLRGWPGLPEHPLGPYLPLALLAFSVLTPTMIFAWTEPDYHDL